MTATGRSDARQRERVSGARRRLLLLDEPFSALDAELRSSLREDFRQRIAHAGMATVLVTHDEVEARAMAQRGFRLVAGRLNVLW